jgi:hypothetical protein
MTLEDIRSYECANEGNHLPPYFTGEDLPELILPQTFYSPRNEERPQPAIRDRTYKTAGLG